MSNPFGKDPYSTHAKEASARRDDYINDPGIYPTGEHHRSFGQRNPPLSTLSVILLAAVALASVILTLTGR